MHSMRLLIPLFFLLLSLPAQADRPTYPLEYRVTLNPEKGRAEVVIETDHGGLLQMLDFNIGSGLYSDFEGNGELEVGDERAVWYPPKDQTARLRFHARIDHERDSGEYDARITEDWAIFRGDNMVPAARVRTDGKAWAKAYLTFELPEHWTSVRTGWEKTEERRFRIDNPDRRFDRPTGWMIAGALGTRVEQLGDTKLVVSAPRGSGLRRMDVVTLVTNVWPEIERAFGTTPPKFTVVGHGDPMWRGALSGPNGIFLHADRPMVSENGTSTVIHELMHVVTGIDSTDQNDWIVEGLAEYYAVELMHRAGALTDARKDRAFGSLADWGDDVTRLHTDDSDGATTARAAVLFHDLDREIRKATDGECRLDHLVHELLHDKSVTTEQLRERAEALIGAPARTLDSPLLEGDD